MAGTYADIFPIGSRVEVRAANPREGTDHEWHRHKGTVVRHGQWIGVRMDRTKHGWPKGPVFICGHNLIRTASGSD